MPFDDSAPARSALDEAVAVAGLAGGEVRLIGVFDETRHVSGFEPAACVIDEIIPRARRELDEALQSARARAQREEVTCSYIIVDASAPDIAPRIVEEADGWHADHIIVGSHGRRGLDRALLGSVAEDILRRSRVPVLVVRTTTQQKDTQPGP